MSPLLFWLNNTSCSSSSNSLKAGAFQGKKVGKEKGKKRLLISITILNDSSKETLVMQRCARCQNQSISAPDMDTNIVHGICTKLEVG